MPLDYGEIRLASCAEGRARGTHWSRPWSLAYARKPVVAVADVGVGGGSRRRARRSRLRVDLEVQRRGGARRTRRRATRRFRASHESVTVDTVCSTAVRARGTACRCPSVSSARVVVMSRLLCTNGVESRLTRRTIPRACRRPGRCARPGPRRRHRNDHAVYFAIFVCDVGGDVLDLLFAERVLEGAACWRRRSSLASITRPMFFAFRDRREGPGPPFAASTERAPWQVEQLSAKIALPCGGVRWLRRNLYVPVV